MKPIEELDLLLTLIRKYDLRRIFVMYMKNS